VEQLPPEQPAQPPPEGAGALGRSKEPEPPPKWQEQREMSFSVSMDLHLGQEGVSSPKTSSSKVLLQALQWYS
jgi:hypothetical protein